MTEMNDNGNFELTGDVVTVTLNKNNTQVISGISNYEMGKHGGEFTIEQNQNEKIFSNINCALFNQENNQDINPQHLPYENSHYRSEFGLQQDANMNNAEHTYNSYIKSEVFNKPPVHETNELQYQYDICEMLNKPECTFLPSKKEKNKPYLINYEGPLGPELTTKRHTEKTKASVRMNIKMAASYNCRIYLKYDDLASLNNPVKICNTHEKEIENEINPKPMFKIIGHKEVQYEEYNGHPCYRIDSEGDYISQFLCWNSCQPHRSNKKNINIHVRFCDNESGICSEEKIILRVAENVKREAGITGPVKVENVKREVGITAPVKVENVKWEAGITGSVKVRKRSIEEFPENESTQLIFIEESDDLQPPLKKQMLCIQVDSEEDIELYKMLARRLGNELNIFPVDDAIIPVDDIECHQG